MSKSEKNWEIQDVFILSMSLQCQCQVLLSEVWMQLLLELIGLCSGKTFTCAVEKEEN